MLANSSPHAAVANLSFLCSQTYSFSMLVELMPPTSTVQPAT